MKITDAFIVCLFCCCCFWIRDVLTQETCFNRNLSQNGTCISIEGCSSAKAALKKDRILPQMCRFNGTTPIVCCVQQSAIQERKLPRKSALKCIEYGEYVEKHFSECFKTLIAETLIFAGGGVEAKLKEFPHMVALGYEPEDGGTAYICGGSLISERFVVTAAHCLSSRLFGDPKTARIGEFNLTSAGDDEHVQELKVAKIHRHPDYDRRSKYNDIALLELEKRVNFTPFAYPACLADSDENRDLSRVLATGWGNTNAWGDPSDVLLKVKIRIIPQANCSRFFQAGSKLAQGISKQTHICAGTLDGSQDTCKGDSGGPLQRPLEKYCVYELVGITSFGKPCLLSSAPGVYTKIHAYLDWIESIVWP